MTNPLWEAMRAQSGAAMPPDRTVSAYSRQMFETERRRSDLSTVAENSARLARVTLLHKTIGSGEVKVNDFLPFGITFLGVPTFTSGYEIQSPPISLHFPLCGAFVYEWEMSTNGRLCTGAKVGFVVDDAGGGAISHNIVHHLHFEGQAIKNMPDAG